MVIELPAETPANRMLPMRHVYLIGSVCLICGLAAGYSGHSWRMPATASPRVQAAAPFHHPDTGQRPSLAQMQQMANQQAAPMIEKLKADPANVGLLMQVGALYHATQQYQ